MQKLWSCGDCKYNLDGYCSSVPPYRKNPDSVQLSPQFAQWAATAGRDDLLRYKEPEPGKRKVLEALKAGDKLPAVIVHSVGVTVR